MKERPNIILITTDQQRFDTLGINGNNQIKTPNIDRLAASGVHFTNAFVQNSVCVPSRACIQTGRYPHEHGVTYMESVVDDTPGLPEHEITFMEHLQQNGYYTGAVGKIHMYPEKGFDWHNLTGGKGCRWLQSEGSELGPGPLGPNYAAWLENKRPGAYEQIYEQRRTQQSYQHWGVMDIPLTKDEYVEHWISEQAQCFIDERPDKTQPFFLWYGCCGPHTPFDPPEPYKSMYDPKDMPLPLETPEASWRDRGISEALMRRAVAYYWGMVTCIDDYIGEFEKYLKDNGLYDNTMIIFTSDHGEMLGDKNLAGKCVLYDTIIRVPTWIKPPAGTKYVARSVNGITEVMNIAPTILDYAHVPIPQNMSARSWRPVIEGASDAPEAIFSEFVSNTKDERVKCVRTASWKYIKYFVSGQEMLFDLDNDPDEINNLAEEPAFQSKKNELKDMMLNWLARR